MARTSMGGDTGIDDACARHQHHRPVLNAKEILVTFFNHKDTKAQNLELCLSVFVVQILCP